MSDIAIRVENLSKRYRFGVRQKTYRTLRESLTDSALTPFRVARSAFQRTNLSTSQPSDDFFWALQSVCFEVKRGEAIGIIGRNGAGKSTLLKILSRITEPTEGCVELDGRVGSLLEVGSGFHPELTGRENIYLNGAILGMKKAEIERRFDEIVDFAELEQFLDTPVKRYSSGMHMRLAFAVAAHLEPEILLVDEVLAVGDAQFQKKCLGKMGDVAKEGRTVLLVSHNMAAVAALCRIAVLLDSGRIIFEGLSRATIDRYLQSVHETAELNLTDRRDRAGSQLVRFTHFQVRGEDGTPLETVLSGQDITIALGYKSNRSGPIRNLKAAIVVNGKLEENLFQLSTDVNGSALSDVPPSAPYCAEFGACPCNPADTVSTYTARWQGLSPTGYGTRPSFRLKRATFLDRASCLQHGTERSWFITNGRSRARLPIKILPDAEWKR